MPASNGRTSRRSSRVPAKVPVRVTSLEPNGQFSEVCETMVVSAHGCALRFPIRLSSGIPLRLHSTEGREAIAYVVACMPMGSDGQDWVLGARLERPGNFWGLDSFPEDWRVLEMPAPAAQQPPKKSAPGPMVVHKPQTRSASSQAILSKIEEQLSEERLRGIFAKYIRPLQEEMSEVREKLSREARRNRFEVSLGHIPPEVVEKLWERLRQDVGAKVLEQTREQSAEAFSSAKAAIDQKIGEALSEFRNRLSGELHTVQQRAQALSQELTLTTQQQVRLGVQQLQRQSQETRGRLETYSEELVSSLERRLSDAHNAYRREMEQIQTDSAAKAAQLQTEVSDLGRAMGALNEAVRRLEAELDGHLQHLAEEIVAGARTQLESAVAAAIKDLQTQAGNEADKQVDEVCTHLRTIQNRIEKSFLGSLKIQGEESAQVAGQQIDELAQQSVERWRLALARDLNSVARALGEQLREEIAAEGERGQAASAD
jgi:hypothetical protein